MDKLKYPRTYHLPWSPGATSDDKILKFDHHFRGNDVIVTIKMDGENTSFTKDYIHARSVDGRDHPSRAWVKGFWGGIKYKIPEGVRICGENMYAKHSIYYDNLESYFLCFNIWKNDECLSLFDTLDITESLGIVMVPVLYNGLYDEMPLDHINDLVKNEEGYVVRNTHSFKYEDFDKNVAKYVRNNHVQTDEQWMQQKIIPNKLNVK